MQLTYVAESQLYLVNLLIKVDVTLIFAIKE